MTTKAREAVPSVVAEARKRFEKSRTARKHGLVFDDLKERFERGDKFDTIAAELKGSATGAVLASVFYGYFGFLEEERRFGRKVTFEDYKARERARRELDLSEDSPLRRVLELARSAGYRAEIVLGKFNVVLATMARINGHLCVIYSAQGKLKSDRRHLQFGIRPSALRKKRGRESVKFVILYLIAAGERERMFTYTTTEIIKRLLERARGEKKSVRISISSTPPRYKTSSNDWSEHEGEKGLMRLDVPA